MRYPGQIFLVFLLLFLPDKLCSQNLEWWNEIHDYDGVSSWRNYITYSAAKMGPNALPVPEINRGDFSSKLEFTVGLEQHLASGDRTSNALTDLLVPVVPERAAFRIIYRPYEYFRTDTITRDLRAARDKDGEGHSFGDVYFVSLFQIVKDHDRFPDILISFGVKTASGTNVGSARHTDSPGYYFDASLGKTYSLQRKLLKSIRPYGSVGFYSYQTNRLDYLQNDAPLLGAGLLTSLANLSIDNQLASYIGYFRNGDQPLVYRLQIDSKREQLINYRLRFQLGIHDQPFNSVSLSLLFGFENFRVFWGKEL